MAYLSGQYLCQTLYTCLFLHQHTLHPRVQVPLVLSLKTVQAIRQLLCRSTTVAPEDFVFDNSGFTLFDEVSDTMIVEEMRIFVEDMCFSKDINDDDSATVALNEALLCRLEFQRVCTFSNLPFHYFSDDFLK
jgi:hypothetical protein